MIHELVGHGRLLCSCGNVIMQCRCIEGHRHTVISQTQKCADCKVNEQLEQDRAMTEQEFLDWLIEDKH